MGMSSDNTNLDCEKCSYKTMMDDGGGEYEDIEPYCIKLHRFLEYVKDNNKPCKLPKGSYFETKIVHNFN